MTDQEAETLVEFAWRAVVTPSLDAPEALEVFVDLCFERGLMDPNGRFGIVDGMPFHPINYLECPQHRVRRVAFEIALDIVAHPAAPLPPRVET